MPHDWVIDAGRRIIGARLAHPKTPTCPANPTRLRLRPMPSKPKPQPDDAAQSKRFIDAAKAAGVDESGEKIEKAFDKIIRAKPSKG